MVRRKAFRRWFRPIALAPLFALLLASTLHVPVLHASVPPASGAPAATDTFIAPNPGPGSIDIEGNWQFHLGDDPNWSQPGFDDSGWEQLAAAPWGEQTHPGYTGFAWYRKRINLTGNPSRIAVLIPPVRDAYEVFWNGEKIGECGKLPPQAWWWLVGRGMVFPIGAARLQGVLALRVWEAPLFFPIRAKAAAWWANRWWGRPRPLRKE